MTKEQFDQVKWHVGMRCTLEWQEPKLMHGTIVAVNFAERECSVRWDGKTKATMWLSCDSIKLEEEL